MPLKCWAQRGALFTIGILLVGHPDAVLAQTDRTVGTAENFRREPNGVVLARLNPGAPLRVLATQGNWTEVELAGSVWLPSLLTSGDPEHDLVVATDGGENLRAGPAGTILGRLEEGALLDEVDRGGSWARVSRRGWIWSASLAGQASASSPPAPSTASPDGGGGSPDGPAARAPGGFASVGSVGGPILTAPDGDTLAMAAPASEIQVVRREGNWARVRLEGWMWMPAGAPGDGEATATETVQPTALEPNDLRSGSHAGRVVQWTIQFISLERAEAIRTDFFEGEPFLLARFGSANGPFVYVAVPVERLSEVEGLVPLERVSVTGRVRTGASALTGAPIIDLIDLTRSREDS